MEHLIKYNGFLNESDIPSSSDNIWKVLDETADRINTEGYGKPIDDLIANEPIFGIERYGKKLCDPDVLYERFEKLRRKNLILKNISFAERIAMLLTEWGLKDSHGNRLGFEFNPKKLKFSKWLFEHQTLYRGMEANDVFTHNILKTGELREIGTKTKFSFTFLPEIAEKFTIAGYGSGKFVLGRNMHGYVLKTEAKPIDFYIFMGGCLSDEMEVILDANNSPIKVSIHKKIDIK